MALATTLFPRFAVLSIYSKPGRVYYKNESEIVCTEDESVFSTLAKIEVEPAKIDNNLVHLRFCGSNRYWARDANGWIVAKSNQPEEDKSKSTCTLFSPTFDQGSKFFLNHVESGGRVQLSDSGTRLCVNPSSNIDQVKLRWVNWESLVQLPKHVAFKGNNGKYLKADLMDGHAYLRFDGEDDEVRSGYEIQSLPSGHVRIKSDYFKKFWIRGNDWIWADSSDDGDSDKNTLFWPVKLDDNTIALQNEGNEKFCKRLNIDYINGLSASADTITDEARLGVEELGV